MTIAAGRLREWITLEEKAIERDAFGAEIVTWTTVAEVWASAEPIAGREYVALRQAQAEISIRFRLRYLQGINPAMRVNWRGDGYDIIETINVGSRDRELELLCKGAATDA